MRAMAVSSSRSRPMYPTLTRGSSSNNRARRARAARSTGIATTSRSNEMAGASVSGVWTLPCLTGRSMVASYSSRVMILRASTLNSSGEVELSRNPRRLSPTSGWLLTFSGTVVLDQAPHCVHRDLQHPVHVLRVDVLDLAGAELIDA